MMRTRILLLSVCLSISAAAQEMSRHSSVSSYDFLNSIGVCVHIQHGQDAGRIAPLLRYTGIRNVRDAADKNYDTRGLIRLHQEGGVLVDICAGSGASDADLPAVLKMARELHEAGALLAIEGPNEPNNFGGCTYQGLSSDKDKTWLPVARFQRDLYQQVKSDKELKDYPVYGISETGATADNVGLQWLRIPQGANCLMPDGTVYADYLNVHNYMYHPSWQGLADNRVWTAATCGPEFRGDGIYGNHSKTWLKKFDGYTEEELWKVPRVTTETGVRVGDCDGAVTEHIQACHYMNVYLSQFARGWSKTFIYEFLDDGDGQFGFYRDDYQTARTAAYCLHNMTTLLADTLQHKTHPLDYALQTRSESVHDLLLQKKDGTYCLVIWGELVSGKDQVILSLKKARSVTLCDPMQGLEPVQKYGKTDSLTLEISDHPVILMLN